MAATGKIPGKMLKNASVATAKLNINANLPMGSNRITGLADGIGAQDAVTVSQLGAATGGTPTIYNKNMIASVTTVDGSLASVRTMADTPVADSYVQVMVNGVQMDLRGDKNGDCYFSADGGTTAKTLGAIADGDLLYWNGTKAGFQLDADDRLDYNYNVPIGTTSSSSSP